MLNVFCDGSIRGSHWGTKAEKLTTLPHIWGGYYVLNEDGSVLQHNSLDFGSAPNRSANHAEYGAVRSALHWLVRNNHCHHAVRVHSDSQVVMCQLDGTYNAHDPILRGMRDHVRTLASWFPRVSYHWIRREENQIADVLSKGLQLYDHVPTWDEVLAALPKPKKKRSI